MVDSKLVRKGKQVGVRFQSGQDNWEVLFGREAGASGHITLKRNGRAKVDRDLTREVTPQGGLYP
jgi:hypothetical protein